MPTYKFTYFDGKGRGENTRMLFTLKGQAFEDVRITFADWPKIKETTPFGSVPMLEVDGKKKYCQTRAIERYLANKFGLYGKSDEEKLLADMVTDCVGDMFGACAGLFFVPAEKKAEAEKKYLEEKGPLVANLENILVEHKYPVRKPAEIMWSDVVIHNFLEMAKQANVDHMVHHKAQIPTLIKIRDAVAANDKIKKWVEKSEKK